MLSGADPRKGMHEDEEYCYKKETIPRGPGSPKKGMMFPYKWNNLYYPACPPNYHSVGCCICAPNCPLGMTDLGYKCLKDSYPRHGTLWECPNGEEQSGDLCYPKCDGGKTGHGPVCYGSCPEGTNECGPLCLRSGEMCDETLMDVINEIYPMIIDFAEHSEEGTKINISNFSEHLIHPNCDDKSK